MEGHVGNNSNEGQLDNAHLDYQDNEQDDQQQDMQIDPDVQYQTYAADGASLGQLSADPLAAQQSAQDSNHLRHASQIQLDDVDFLNFLERKTGWPKLYIAIAIIVIAWVIIVALFGVQVFCSFIAFAYPAYMTYKTLETDDTQLHIQWLMYWVVFALFNMTEFIGDKLFTWFPYYVPCKMAFLMWCFLPQTQGSSRIYWMFVQPLLKRNEEQIDEYLDKFRETVVQALGEIRDVGMDIFFAFFKQAGSSIFFGRKKQSHKKTE